MIELESSLGSAKIQGDYYCVSQKWVNGFPFENGVKNDEVFRCCQN